MKLRCQDWPRRAASSPCRCARGRNVGALLVESESDQFFSYDDEDALLLLGGQLAQALLALQAEELDTHAPSAPHGESVGAGRAASARPALRIRHYARDQSVFIDDAYLIKGVAGAILWKLVNDFVHRGRDEFSTRELRLAAGELRLPELQDNLGVRLLLLERRLAERDCGLRIERTGRGRFRLRADSRIELL
jgi:adenylate cyclase